MQSGILFLGICMKNWIFVFFCILFFSGCMDRLIINEPLKDELLGYTSKTTINNKNPILIVGAYINPIYKVPTGIDRFIVAISGDNKLSKVLAFDYENSSQKYYSSSIVLLDQNNEQVKNLAFNLPWAKYYQIDMPSIEARKLTLLLEFKLNFKAELDFQKVSKSLYWNR